MIRNSIEKGTKVWNEEHGEGTFDGWYKNMFGIIAIIQLEREICLRTFFTQELTEIEEEIKS